MAIQDIPDGLLLPSLYYGAAVPVTITKMSLSVANARGAHIFQVPRTGNIASVIWRTGGVTTGATLDMRIETVDLLTGDPTGTLVNANANVSRVLLATDDNLVFTETLTAVAAVTKGQLIAFVIVNPAASFGNFQIAGYSYATISPGFPYQDLYGGASWVASSANFQAITLLYDDGVCAIPKGGLITPTTITNTTFNSGSTPDVRGLRFQLPYSVRVTGAWLNMDLDGDCKVMLVTTAYNQGAGTGILATATLDKDTRGLLNGMLIFVTFDNSVTLTAATNYRLVVEPTSVTSLTVYDVSVASLAMLDAMSGGSNFHLTTAKDPTVDGDWTNYNSGTFRSPFMGLIIDGIDNAGGAASGGSYAFTG
jgi:hypothetical protein